MKDTIQDLQCIMQKMHFAKFVKQVSSYRLCATGKTLQLSQYFLPAPAKSIDKYFDSAYVLRKIGVMK